MKIKKTSGDNYPTANLAINKSRIKKYGKNDSIPSYYLEKGQEFQLELFNPTQEKILTTIKLNNKSISGGLILRPGERVFLDRYLQSNKRFLFDTYKVDNNKKSKKAIKPNGDVEIAFFKEIINTPPLWNSLTWNNTVMDNTLNFTTTNFTDFSTNNVNLTGQMDLNSFGQVDNTSDNISVSLSKGKSLGRYRSSTPPTEIETGRVEEGSESDQKLLDGSGEFEMTSFHVVKYKLLAKSEEKLSTVQYYTKYCGNCGAKCKTPYCSYCGQKQ